ncbi:MAG: TROVE domain-containing protein [Myxococcota bacterium]
MTIKDMLAAFSTRKTPQHLPIPGEAQVRDDAGGYTFAVDDWVRLDRFLVLGSDAPTYYATARALTRDNAAAVERCVRADGLRTVRRIVEISEAGRAPRNDPAIFALAMCMKLGDEPVRKAAQQIVPRVCRIGTHLFGLAEAVQGFGGWGRGTKRAFARWYTDRPPKDLAYQAIKYQRRDGWSNRDVLRLAKPAGFGPDTAQGAVLHWITKGWDEVGAEPPADEHLRRIWAFERAKRAESPADTVRLVREHDLPRECVRTDHLDDPAVWEALLQRMPVTALVRNLARMTTVGLLTPGSDAVDLVTRKLGDPAALRAARIHPLALLVALKTYQQGHGERRSLRWSPLAPVVDALDAAFYTVFQNVPATGGRWLLALDVSGSMCSPNLLGMPGISPRVATAALAMVTAAVEPRHQLVAFTANAVGYGGRWGGGAPGLMELELSPRQRLDDVVRATSELPFGGTDCALPMVWAKEQKREVDVFVVLTDNETWAGDIHPIQALRAYRRETGIPAKLVVVAMTSTGFTIADPSDAGCLDVVGFDTATPALMSDFATA